MGVISLSVVYATLVVSCMFTPKLLIGLLGHRWTIVVSFLGYVVYMAANGYAVWPTMMPASVLVGLVITRRFGHLLHILPKGRFQTADDGGWRRRGGVITAEALQSCSN